MTQNVRMHFNPELPSYTYDILFHDINSLSGHFEPLLHKRKMQVPFSLQTNPRHMPNENDEFELVQDNIEMVLGIVKRIAGFRS